MRKEEKQNRVWVCWEDKGWIAILSKNDLTVKVTFEQRLEEDKGITHVNICGHMGKSVRGRGNSMCKDPKQEV